MRKDVGVDGDAQRIGQLVWMLFLKIFDDREQEAELLEDDYVSPIPERLQWRNWAADPEGITGDELMRFVNDDLFNELKYMGPAGDPRGYVIRSVFEDAYNYMKSGTLMRQVVNKLNEIDSSCSSFGSAAGQPATCRRLAPNRRCPRLQRNLISHFRPCHTTSRN